MRKHFFSFLTLSLAAFSGCSKSDPPAKAEASSPAASSAAFVEACSLLTSEEISRVQGEPLKDAKPNTKTDTSVSISQCFFSLATWDNSISLQVVQRGTGDSARDGKEVWNETFRKDSALMQGSGKTGAPKKIEGLGDEAYWVGNDAIGALSVLKGNRYITISVGGAGNQETKIKKSSELARFVLGRL